MEPEFILKVTQNELQSLKTQTKLKRNKVSIV